MSETVVMKMPALAVVGTDRRIVRSTETFRRRYEDAETLCEKSPEIDRVLTGRADVATLNLGDLSVEIEAVTDASGRRQAMLTLPASEATPAVEPPLTALRDAAEESVAIVWIKDLEGRYLFANERYVEDLETAEDRLLGNTDADLPETETVDGPRRRFAEDGLEEPLQLEYTVPAIDGRPAMAAFRFALRDETGQAVAICGVAAPVTDAHVARDEAVRLMQLERWNRLDPTDVRAELLEQWHVQAAPPRPVEPEVDEAPSATVAEQAEAATAPSLAPEPEPQPEVPPEPEPTLREPEPAAAPAPHIPSETAELLATDLQLARKWADRAEELQGELLQAQARIRQAESDAQQALASAARAAEQADRWRAEFEDARRELERAQADAHAARSEAEAARGELGAARAQAESLRGPSTAALRLSEELGRAAAAERERGDELERLLARMRARLTDFESALDHDHGADALIHPRVQRVA